jgi:hypothetical protein
VRAKILEHVKKISCGRYYSAAVTRKGDLYVWGTTDLNTSETPELMKTGEYVTDVGTGERFLVFLTADKKMFHVNFFSETFFRPVPVDINFPPLTVTCTGVQTFVTSKNSEVYSFNSWKQKYVTDEILDIACGWTHVLLLSKKGEVWGQGDCAQGQLDIKRYSALDHLVHVPVARGQKISQIGAGNNFSFALTSEGKLFMWGTWLAVWGYEMRSATKYTDEIWQTTTVSFKNCPGPSTLLPQCLHPYLALLPLTYSLCPSLCLFTGKITSSMDRRHLTILQLAAWAGKFAGIY